MLTQLPVDRLSASERRVAVALAEAILPGGHEVPAADERTVRRVERLLSHVSPHLVRAWIAAQRALDAAAILHTGHRFCSLPSDRQQRLLRRWQQDPLLRGPLVAVAAAYKLCHFDDPRVYRALGGERNRVEQLEQPRWLENVQPADTFEDEELECEVVVVGTGAGGAVVGKELADRGFAVCYVEEGDLHRRDAFDGSAIRAHEKFYRNTLSVGNAPMFVLMGRLVGGSTAINGGSCFRTPPAVLDRWCREMGTDDFCAEQMEPWFDRVERTLQVEPADRRFIGPAAELMAQTAEKLGWSHFLMQRNAPGCEGSGFCDFGCRTDARRGTNLSYVPDTLEQGGFLLTGLRAERVLIEHGRAVGIEGSARDGRTIRVRARAVVFAGGAVPTPAFLLRQGICNSSGQVGRNLTLHPSTGIHARFDQVMDGARYIPQGYGIDEFAQEGLLFSVAQPDRNYLPLMMQLMGQDLMQALDQRAHIANFGILASDVTANGRVRLTPGGGTVVSYNLTREDVDRTHLGMIRIAEMALEAGARELYPGVHGGRTLRDRADLKRFARERLTPAQLAMLSYHPLGTCRIGPDPRSSVVGLDHQAHDLPGFYIVDGSTVPGPLGVNPQITIMAMATRAAAKIADTLSGV